MTEFFRRSIRFNTVYVIQLLRPADETTGQELYHTVLHPAAAGWGITPRFRDLRSTSELLPALRDVAAECRTGGMLPILHLETHGSKDGLGLSASDLVRWRQLTDALIEINRATELNLLVTMAACYGAHLINTIDPERPAPLWGLVGPDEKADVDDVRLGFTKFFEALSQRMELCPALEALRASVQHPERWTITTAEVAFAIGFGHYLDKHGTPAGLRRTLMATLRALKKRDKWKAPPGGLRQRIEQELADHSDVFDRFKKRFLMLDLFPANASRFPVTPEDAKRVYQVYRSSGGR